MNELVELAERMIKAFKNFECFVFEKEELEKVRDLLQKTDARKYVRIIRADPRYEYVYMVVPWSLEFEKVCVAKVKQALSEGKIDRETYNKRYNEMVTQCIRHYERERVKKVVSLLEEFVRSNKEGSGGIGGKAFIIPY